MEKKCPLWAHMVRVAQTEESGAASYKAKKLAGAISEVREKYATEAQSRGSDAFHARPPEFRGILEFFSDISRGSCAFLLNPSAPTPFFPPPDRTRFLMRRNVPRTRLRDVPCTCFYVSASLVRSYDSSLPADI